MSLAPAENARLRLRASGFKELPKRVEAMMLFGSGARGDQDASSDVDFIAFVSARQGKTLAATKKELERACTEDRASITLYAKETAEEMAAKGSLFLWHLKLEGRVIYSAGDWLHRLLMDLRPYSQDSAARDITTLRQVLVDIQIAVTRESPTAVFEAATLFTVLRNTGIVAAFVSQRPRFGRRAPVEWLSAIMGRRYPYSRTEIDLLANCRLAYNGKQALDSMPTIKTIAVLAQKADQVLDFAIEIIKW